MNFARLVFSLKTIRKILQISKKCEINVKEINFSIYAIKSSSIKNHNCVNLQQKHKLHQFTEQKPQEPDYLIPMRNLSLSPKILVIILHANRVDAE